MARRIPEPVRDENISLEEIEEAVLSAELKEKWSGGKQYVCLIFMYAGRARECRVAKRLAWQVSPYGHKAQVMAGVVLKHVLEYPNGNIPDRLKLRVLLGNE